MGRVKVKDQYGAEHWIEEVSLAYAPWRDYEVIQREDDAPAGDVSQRAKTDTASISAPSESAEAPASPLAPAPEPGADERPSKPRRSAAE